MGGLSLAWMQLIREKRRLVAALAGISFAVMLMLMQIGFREALFTSMTLWHQNLKGDLVLINPQYEYLIASKNFTERRLYQALAFDEVESIGSFYTGLAAWKHPETHRESNIFVMGFDPAAAVFAIPGVDEGVRHLRLPDTALFDLLARPEFGPVPQMIGRDGQVVTEVNNRRIEVRGLFQLGTSFGANASLITSEQTFLRLFPWRQRGLVDVGIITLRAGCNVEAARDRLAAVLPGDVEVLTRLQFTAKEKKFFSDNMPIGFIFNLGMVMGMIVGAVIVYQILYTDVSDHLSEYATLKAMGHGDRYLFSIVLNEAMILSVLGFLPGFGISQGLYVLTHRTTHLPIVMTLDRVAFVLTMTVLMCVASGALAVRRLRSADPAEIF